MKPLDELREGALVAADQALDKRGIVGQRIGYRAAVPRRFRRESFVTATLSPPVRQWRDGTTLG